MTVIEMAREAGIRDCTCDGTKGCLERFAALVAAQEREACAVRADEYMLHIESVTMNVGDAIRARSNT